MACSVDGLRPYTKGNNLVVKVLDSKIVATRARGGKRAEILVGDQTGLILLVANDDQVDIAEPGSYITLTNAKTEVVGKALRVYVDKWGSIAKAEGESFQPRSDFNMSLIEFEFVAFDETA